MDTALAQKHHNIGFVRLWIEVVNQEYGEIDLFAYHHGCNFGIAAHGAGVHAANVGKHALFVQRIADQPAGCSCANQMMVG
ncbi:hypothetical protein SDC9_187984 [bioreactor metagenome]|uniref:Uncharacterized protein n=1 Tax=bioreactor metagenome TaxID=1076179 RepID=A0A645HNB3_9ZZZZ